MDEWSTPVDAAASEAAPRRVGVFPQASRRPYGCCDRGFPHRRPALPQVASAQVHAFGVKSVVERLRSAGGGYEIVHESPGVELGVYVLVAPEPDRQQPHADDEIYVVLEGSGVLDVDGKKVPVKEGDAVFVEAGADHRFSAYEQLAVLVVFERARG
jgi:mannose-6-phosphate isomerase-like protein (cupin superfamily)